VQRQGHNRGRTALQAGDLLLLEGPWAALDALVGHDDVLLVDSPPLVRRQSVPRSGWCRWCGPCEMVAMRDRL